MNKLIIGLGLIASMHASQANAQVCTPSTIAMCVSPPGYTGPVQVIPSPSYYDPPPSYSGAYGTTSPYASGCNSMGCGSYLGGMGAGAGVGNFTAFPPFRQ